MAVTRGERTDIERSESGNFDPQAEKQRLEDEGVRAVYPELDGEGGTKFVYGATDEEASYEDWADQNGTPPTGDQVNPVDEDDEKLTPAQRQQRERDQKALKE